MKKTKPKCITRVGDTVFIDFHNFDEYGRCKDCSLEVSGMPWEEVKRKSKVNSSI